MPWTINGRLDIITTGRDIIDFKVTKNIKTPTDYIRDLQLATYYYFYRQYFRNNPRAIYVDQLIYDKKGNIEISRVPIEMGWLYVDEIPAIYSRIYKAIALGIFYPNTNNKIGTIMKIGNKWWCF